MFSRKEIEQLPQNELDRHTRIRVVNKMIHQLEKIRSRSRERKNDIIRVESFLNDLTVPLGKKNEQLEQRIVKTQNKAKQSQISNIQKKIKKRGSRSLLFVVVLLQLFSLIFLVTGLDLIQSEHTSTTPVGELKSKYLIQNLKGDTIDTHLSWRLVDDDVLHVNILNGDKFPEMAQVIRDVILSETVLEIDDSLLHEVPKGSKSTYYEGWATALQEASSKKDTTFYIPINYDIIESKNGQGDITLEFSRWANGDGYAGFTKSIADSTQNQILKSHIVIYNIDDLSSTRLETIFRHEFGHALGLAHATDPEDLMHPVILTGFPYISECDIDAILSLYDGEKLSQVVCEK